jgi:shikimate dehydrogenase
MFFIGLWCYTTSEFFLFLQKTNISMPSSKNLLGLIGFPLTHSFSKKYFTQKFENEGLTHAWAYELWSIDNIEKLPEILRGYPQLIGLNVTIPYKESVMPHIQTFDITAQEVGAVNCIKITTQNGKQHLKGYNTDYYGFQKSLLGLLPEGDISVLNLKALILGTGGAAKAVAYALKTLNIPYQYVSRNAIKNGFSYDALTADIINDHRLIINTSPLGMSPNTEGYPPLPYEGIGNQHFMYDLVYNPETTTFMKRGTAQGAKAKSGLDMLYFQAEKGWEIWNTHS